MNERQMMRARLLAALLLCLAVVTAVVVAEERFSASSKNLDILTSRPDNDDDQTAAEDEGDDFLVDFLQIQKGPFPIFTHETTFTLSKVIGTGGFGSVIRGSYINPGESGATQVAVKTYFPIHNQAKDRKAMRFLQLEASILQKLWADPASPENIVRFLGFFIAPASGLLDPTGPVPAPETISPSSPAVRAELRALTSSADLMDMMIEKKLQYYLVIQLCSGSDLLKGIETDLFHSTPVDPLKNPTNTFLVGRALLRAMVTMNTVTSSRGAVAHRDIKPENILRCDTMDYLVLIDFGAAVASNTKTHELPTDEVYRYLGSLKTMPPEAVCAYSDDELGCPKEIVASQEMLALAAKDQFVYAKDAWSVGVVLHGLLETEGQQFWTEVDNIGVIDEAHSSASFLLPDARMRLRISQACDPKFDAKFDGKSHIAGYLSTSSVTLEKYGRNSNVIRVLDGLMTCEPTHRMPPEEALVLLEASQINPLFASRCAESCILSHCDPALPTDAANANCSADCLAFILPFSNPQADTICPGISWRQRCPVCELQSPGDSRNVVRDLEAHMKDKHTECADTPARRLLYCEQSSWVNEPCDTAADGVEYPGMCTGLCRSLWEVKNNLVVDSCEQLTTITNHIPRERMLSGSVARTDIESALNTLYLPNAPPQFSLACEKAFKGEKICVYNPVKTLVETFRKNFKAKVDQFEITITGDLSFVFWKKTTPLEAAIKQISSLVKDRRMAIKNRLKEILTFENYRLIQTSNKVKCDSPMLIQQAADWAKKLEQAVCTLRQTAGLARVGAAAVGFAPTGLGLLGGRAAANGPDWLPPVEVLIASAAAAASQISTEQLDSQLDRFKGPYASLLGEMATLANNLCADVRAALAPCMQPQAELEKIPRLKLKFEIVPPRHRL